ncbi:hypothetical protein [Microbispora sp. ATCC PTA-5024]|uniref:hypothetical protein n=1 Tax=Microbispora sp. ATCC PTA-5024 TaxID=316330 RepID=UPI0003DC09A4|nr:hypothetical protein [Microbispora sp. ATCC PTA-5024]ETK36145.1 hypothetical protein MPTA5024_11000 [Microbispora sp. ATCC PTA-5024]
MSTADRAAELRAQADALDSIAGLEADLAKAKAAYAANPTEKTRAEKQRVALALREARATIRSEGHTVGGDAYVDEEA